MTLSSHGKTFPHENASKCKQLAVHQVRTITKFLPQASRSTISNYTNVPTCPTSYINNTITITDILQTIIAFFALVVATIAVIITPRRRQ